MHNVLHEAEVDPQVAVNIDESAGAESECPSADSEEVMKLQAMLAQSQQELADAKNANLRAHADFDNYRKRLRAERDQEYTRGRDRVLTELLPIIDDFERALTAASDTQATDPLRQGVELILRQFLNLLERYGIKPMLVEGQHFDPKYHDAVARIASNGQPEHTIVGEILRGYLKEGEVFRPAKVVVSVNPEEPITE